MASDRSSKPKLLLADDDVIVTEGLSALLESEFRVVGAVTDGVELVKAARALKPDAVVVDHALPRLNGLDAVRAIRRARLKTRAIVLTMRVDRTYVAEAFEAGAAGFVHRHAGVEELRRALRAVLRGGSYISAPVGVEVKPVVGARTHVGHKLTPRQRQVVQLVAEGGTVKQIARSLALSPKTVEFHKYRIMRDLGITTTAALIQYAIEHALGGATRK